jgi:TetR/AcrR family transcriptional regulator
MLRLTPEKMKIMNASQGRTKDAEATKAAILNAAEVEFGRAGLSGARTETIAEQSAVTRAMIHYYYETKEQLYRAVLERAFSKQIRMLQKLDIHGADVANVLKSFMRELTLAQLDNLNLTSILLFEGVQNEGKYYKEIAFAAIYEPLCSILQRGMDEGVFRKMDPKHTAVTIAGAILFYFCARKNLQNIFMLDQNMLDPEMINQHMESVFALTLPGIMNNEK